MEEQCRPVETSNGTVLVRGSGELTQHDRDMLEQVIQAGRKKAEEATRRRVIVASNRSAAVDWIQANWKPPDPYPMVAVTTGMLRRFLFRSNGRPVTALLDRRLDPEMFEQLRQYERDGLAKVEWVS